MQVAFYAPLKPLDHPVPSGDRQMARLLTAALRHAGHVVEVVSDLRSFVTAPDSARQAAIAEAAAREAEALQERWSRSGRPDLWFTYHNHYKAPDLLGPVVAPRLGLPLVMAEASHASKRAAGWGCWHRAAEAATRAADLHLCFTRRDRDGIADLIRPGAGVVELPPFIDAEAWPAPAQRLSVGGPVRLVTVAMMRPGDKLDSYRFLSAALGLVSDLDWHLTLVGDGPARPQVEAAFAGHAAGRLDWRGTLPPSELGAIFRRADLFVWPGFGEAFGLAYLEAQAMGVPALALDVAGVASVIRSGETGLLVPCHTVADYAAALRRLCGDGEGRRAMAAAAAAWVRRERTLDGAARIIDRALNRLAAASSVHA